MATIPQEITNSDDIIDSRDILERLEWLDADDEDDRDEHRALTALVEEIRQNAGESPEDGVGLIRDTYFQEYAQDLAEDIGAINRDASWPNCCIDWEQAARELQCDYSLIDFDGEPYWVRS